jgi:SAM-dependent methyltransferase
MTTDSAPSVAAVDPVPDWRQSLIYSAARDAGILAALPGTVAEVAATSGADGDATRVVLEALEVWQIVTRNGDGRYVAGPGRPSPDDDAALTQQARFITGTAVHLPDRLRGVVNPMAQRSSEELERWQASMAARARKVAPALVDACRAAVPHAKRVLDLGGGHGEYGLEFARRGLAVVLQDRPEILSFPERRHVWAAGGVELFPGDFFEILPEGPFDLVFCAGVTHTMDGEHNRLLYRRARSLVADDGAFAIVTFPWGTPRARLFAVQMLVVGNRGDTHAADDYREWLAEAGFGMEPVALDDLQQSLLLARPT